MRSGRRSFLELSAGTLAAITLAPGRAWPQGSTKRIRLGVVGGGYGADFYWHEHPHCTVTGVAELRADRRARLARVYRCRTEYDSFERMLKEAKDVDAVAIFSGADDHARHVIMALERGWHVVCAVPACQSLDEARALAAAARNSGRRYMMAETSWYRQPAIFMRALVKEKALGRIFYTEAEYYHDRGDLQRLVTDKRARFFDDKGRRNWRWGLPPMFYPTHATAFVVGVTGERIQRVSCLGWGAREHPWLAQNRYENSFWNQSALMQTSGGAMLRCNVFWLAAAEGERAAWYGDEGSFHMAAPDLHADTLKIRTRGKRPVTVPRYWQLDMLPPAMRHDAAHDGAETFLSAEFINALIEDREPAIGLREALAMTLPGLVAHESALKGGTQLPVPELA